MTMTASTRTALFSALLSGMRDGFRHWRLIVIAWLAGLVAATLAAWPVSGLFNRAMGQHPDAARIVSRQDIAPIIESVMTLGEGGAMQGMTAIAQGVSMSLLIALLLAPWLGGMLVASLREGRALRFGELWLGGWREYGRQFRLWLVALIPLPLVAVIAVLGSFWVQHGHQTRIMESVGRDRTMILMWVVGIAGFLAWVSIEAARAAFAADATLRSALRAWLRGLRLLQRRPFSVLLATVVTLVIGAGLALLLQQPALRMAGVSNGMVWLLAQLAVVVLWWSRIARLSSLTAISAPPAKRVAEVAASRHPIAPTHEHIPATPIADA